MRVSFYDILSSHSAAYPRMKAEDYYALAYESEFGRVRAYDDSEQLLINELESIKTDSLEPFTVDIGGGYSRLNLPPVKQYLGADIIISMMNMSRRNDGNDEGFKRKLSLIRRSSQMGILPTVAADVEKCVGDPAHSALYKRLYGDSYRIISAELAVLVPAICLISEALGKAEKVSVAIDGRKASGKTETARVISLLFASELNDGRLKLTEGSATLRECAENRYDVKLFLDTDTETRKMRIIEQGGNGAWEDYCKSILPEEERYIAEHAPNLICDLVIRT